MSPREDITEKEEKVKGILVKLAKPFPPELIQWRPGAVTEDKTKALALAFVDPRHYIQRLNDVVGLDWSDEYTVLNGGKIVLCKLMVAGVSRCDVGEEYDKEDPNMVTTAASQAFKRVCVKFGIGSELYMMPKIWASFDGKRKCFTESGLAELQKVAARTTDIPNAITQTPPETSPGLRRRGRPRKNVVNHVQETKVSPGEPSVKESSEAKIEWASDALQIELMKLLEDETFTDIQRNKVRSALRSRQSVQQVQLWIKDAEKRIKEAHGKKIIKKLEVFDEVEEIQEDAE